MFPPCFPCPPVGHPQLRETPIPRGLWRLLRDNTGGSLADIEDMDHSFMIPLPCNFYKAQPQERKRESGTVFNYSQLQPRKTAAPFFRE